MKDVGGFQVADQDVGLAADAMINLRRMAPAMAAMGYRARISGCGTLLEVFDPRGGIVIRREQGKTPPEYQVNWRALVRFFTEALPLTPDSEPRSIVLNEGRA